MPDIVIGVLAFVLYYLYDFNTVWTQRRIGTFFFSVGTGLLGISSIHLMYRAIQKTGFEWMRIPWLVPAAVFLILLIYTLFFALPVKEAYSGVLTEDAKVYRKGVYALCRHPGVLWFVGLYVCFAAFFHTREWMWAVVVFSTMDVLYVILQDLVIFPRQFTDYEDYRKTTPFLLPTPGSIGNAYHTLREEFSK